MAGTIRKLVISDFHLGDGQPEGELNPWENFHHDDKFAELLRYYSTDYYEDEELELIVNGDFFDLLMVRHDGGHPVEITERIAVAKLVSCLDGHPAVVQALREFVAAPRKRVTFLPGNHDFELVFPACARLLQARLGSGPGDPRVRVLVERPFYEFDGVQVHHGMQFEVMNRYPWDRMFITEGVEEPILWQPFGSIFILTVLCRLKQRRPYVDQVQPFRLYLFGALFFDTLVALTLIALALRTFFEYRVLPLFRRGGHRYFVMDWAGFLGFSAFPSFEGFARKIFKRNRHVHTIIMGHTHLRSVRRFGHDRTYINTGTWSNLISLEISNLGVNRDLSYATVEYFPDGQRPRAQLRAWHGYRDLWTDIYY